MTKKSMLDELEQLIIAKDKKVWVVLHASHIIESAINLLEFISQHYSQTEYLDLERKFLNSIKTKDASKFVRSLDRKANVHINDGDR